LALTNKPHLLLHAGFNRRFLDVPLFTNRENYD
jgi:hypothetical protein